MSEQKPSVGRVVHYVARGSANSRFSPACRAATITETLSDSKSAGKDELAVGLAVVNPSGMFFHSLEMGGIDHDAGREVTVYSYEAGGPLTSSPRTKLCDGLEHKCGTWHWPERV